MINGKINFSGIKTSGGGGGGGRGPDQDHLLKGEVYLFNCN